MLADGYLSATMVCWCNFARNLPPKSHGRFDRVSISRFFFYLHKQVVVFVVLFGKREINAGTLDYTLKKRTGRLVTTHGCEYRSVDVIVGTKM